MSPEPATRAVHAGRDHAPGAPAAPPLVSTSVFTSTAVPGEGIPYQYGRDGNPTWEALEAGLGALEEAQALVFASGQAAMLALLLALTEERPRLLVQGDGYYGTRVLCERLSSRGVEPVVLDLGDERAVEAALAGGPAAVLAESPTNPLLRVLDLERLAGLAAAAGAPLVMDNTVATAILQRPLELGATASLYSLTKGVAGHSDLLLGAVVTRDEPLLGRLRAWRSASGGIAGAFEAWLAHRSLATLPLRIVRQSENALALARSLERHPSVERVHYPGTDETSLALARRQMPQGFGPLLSFVVAGGAKAADAVVAAARLVRTATSLGGVESSWERRARWPSETSAPPGLIRLSAGVEAIEDLLADIEQALGAA